MSKNNSPNQSIIIVDTILGLTSIIGRQLDKLRELSKTPEQQYAIKDAIEQMDILQRVYLHKLRQVFE